MPLELAAVLAAIGTSRAIVGEGVALVKTIRGGLSGKNDKAKAELTEKLAGIEEQLANVGKVAEVAESYLRTYDNISDLLATTEELGQFVRDAAPSLEDSRAASYARDWERIAAAYRRVGQESDAPQQVLLDRAQWYDARDSIQIAGKLREFTAAYDRAKGSVDGRQADGARSELEQMIRPLREVQTLLLSTLYEQIFPTLQRLKA